MMETISVQNVNPHNITRLEFDASIQRGYVYRCTPVGDDIEGEGFHGTDFPPCAAEYLCDDHKGGYLVISGSDDVAEIVVIDGWVLAPVDDLERGECFYDGTWTLVVVRRHWGHEYTVAGSL